MARADAPLHLRAKTTKERTPAVLGGQGSFPRLVSVLRGCQQEFEVTHPPPPLPVTGMLRGPLPLIAKPATTPTGMAISTPISAACPAVMPPAVPVAPSGPPASESFPAA